MTKIAVLGTGSWGTVFAKVLADAHSDTQVCMYSRRAELAHSISTFRRNPDYFSDVLLPENITATTDPRLALEGAEIVVVAVPAQAARPLMEELRTSVEPDAIIVSLMKGLERGTHLRMSQMLAETLAIGPERIAVVSGPNLAKEIVQEEPTASVICARSPLTAARLASLCTTTYFRPYTNTDIIGVEIGGIVKNVIALAVGICEGRGMGDNTKASIMTRGLAETTRLAMALGGSAQTLAGLAGMGDLVATCSSPLSRNNTAGRLLAEGKSPEEIAQRMNQTAEGIKSAAAVAELAAQYDVQMPITQAVVGVIEGRFSPGSMEAMLMGRDLKAEGEL